VARDKMRFEQFGYRRLAEDVKPDTYF